eukprot:sb/3466309/
MTGSPEIDLKPNELSPREGSISKQHINPITGIVVNGFDRNLSSILIAASAGDGGPWIRFNLRGVHYITSITYYYLFYTDWYPQASTVWCQDSPDRWNQCIGNQNGTEIWVTKYGGKESQCGTLSIDQVGLSQQDHIYKFNCGGGGVFGDGILLEKAIDFITIAEILVETSAPGVGPEIDLKPNELSPREGSISKQHINPITGIVVNGFDRNLSSILIAASAGNGGPWIRFNLRGVHYITSITYYYLFYTDWYPQVSTVWCQDSPDRWNQCIRRHDGTEIWVTKYGGKESQCGTLSIDQVGLSQQDHIYKFNCGGVFGDGILLEKAIDFITIAEILVETSAPGVGE